MVRLTPEVGWVAGRSGRFQTADGGKTWHARPLTSQQESASLGLATTPHGQHVGHGVLTPLEGVSQKSDEEWLGWAGEHVVATFDVGRTWLTIGRFPQAPVQKLVFLKRGTALARTETGTLLRSDSFDFGRTWEPTTDAMDAYDFAVAAGPAPGEVRVSSPFECVLSTVPASMSVEFARQGCFHFIGNTLRLELSQGGAKLSGELGGREEASGSTH